MKACLGSIANCAASSGPGDLSTVAEQVKLFRDENGEWCVDVAGSYSLEDERLGTFVVLIRLRKIVEEVGERFTALQSDSGMVSEGCGARPW